MYIYIYITLPLLISVVTNLLKSYSYKKTYILQSYNITAPRNLRCCTPNLENLQIYNLKPSKYSVKTYL